MSFTITRLDSLVGVSEDALDVHFLGCRYRVGDGDVKRPAPNHDNAAPGICRLTCIKYKNISYIFVIKRRTI